MESPANSPTVSRRLSLANLASTFVSSNIDPTEAAVIRKAQMNSDLISAFKSACYPGIKPYITGVGLYTHIAGPSKPSTSTQEEILPSQPRFVPIQRPFGSQDSGSKLPEKVRKAWEDLRDIIKVEGEVVGKLKLGLEHLTERYRGLPVPDLSVFLAHSERQDMLMPWDQPIRRDTVIVEVAMELQSASRRTPDVVGANVSEDDVPMQGMEGEINRKIPSSTQIYGPDPRRQRQ
ncbi:uncharacterized protein yc1106_07798 [Curvularia clavata]|uniref:Uncharacterized protein n=1 Tax=Curvularia clavata TaxID=95742 RepID=A0A9Q8ZFK1_CURCL|nr:uncharacterized protein yc1106_07798 [Curvularia clavata]